MNTIHLPPNAPETRASRIDEFAREARELDPEKAWELVARRETRSMRQHKYLFAAYGMIADHMRDTQGVDHGTDVWHEWFKRRACPHTIGSLQGNTFRVYVSTTSLTVAQFHEYVERIAQICAEELDFALPPPDRDLATRKATETQSA